MAAPVPDIMDATHYKKHYVFSVSFVFTSPLVNASSKKEA
jgi:hypothetical protein